jgi:hypothetical protein
LDLFQANETLTERRLSTIANTNSGDPSVADKARKEVEILDVLLVLVNGQGPKGDKGDPGEPGPKGDKGSTGDKGDPGTMAPTPTV